MAAKKQKQSLASSFRFAFAGIKRAFSERNFKIECVFAVLACVLGAVLRCSATEWLVLVIFIVGVLSAETFNTAIEELTDLESPGINPLAKAAKDMAIRSIILISI